MGKTTAKAHRRVVSSPREFTRIVQDEQRERTRAFGPAWSAIFELEPEIAALGESLAAR
ncbi:MAG: hypothetical protein AAGE01_14450 [Pseudomonadota bacterium]